MTEQQMHQLIDWTPPCYACTLPNGEPMQVWRTDHFGCVVLFGLGTPVWVPAFNPTPESSAHA